TSLTSTWGAASRPSTTAVPAPRRRRSISRCTVATGIDVPSATAATGTGGGGGALFRLHAAKEPRRNRRRYARIERTKAAAPGWPGPPPVGQVPPQSCHE